MEPDSANTFSQCMIAPIEEKNVAEDTRRVVIHQKSGIGVVFQEQLLVGIRTADWIAWHEFCFPQSLTLPRVGNSIRDPTSEPAIQTYTKYTQIRIVRAISMFFLFTILPSAMKLRTPTGSPNERSPTN